MQALARGFDAKMWLAASMSRAHQGESQVRGGADRADDRQGAPAALPTVARHRPSRGPVGYPIAVHHFRRGSPGATARSSASGPLLIKWLARHGLGVLDLAGSDAPRRAPSPCLKQQAGSKRAGRLRRGRLAGAMLPAYPTKLQGFKDFGWLHGFIKFSQYRGVHCR